MDFSGLVEFPELAQQSQPTHIYGTIPTLRALRNSVVPGKLFSPTAFMYAAQCYRIQLDDTKRLMLRGLKATHTMTLWTSLRAKA